MRTWFQNVRRAFQGPVPRRPLPSHRPAVEVLEDRSLPSTVFVQTNLVSDLPGRARFTDKNLVNPWGLVLSPVAPFAIADNGAGVATFHRRSGKSLRMVVTIPAPGGGTSAPTGEVFNPTSDFVIHSGPGGPSGPSTLLWATEDGTIAAWNPMVNQTTAMLPVDRSGMGAVYKGLALGSTAAGNFLYATDFHNGAVDMFDKNFHLVKSFTDPSSDLAGFAPFGIRNLGGLLVVTYAKQKLPDKHDDEAGPGNGFIDVFNTDGHLLKRLVSQGPLNSPWGLAIAPNHFGRFSGALLVGNFGNGRINAFDPVSGAFLGTLKDRSGHPLAIDGLWSLTFGTGQGTGSGRTLFFTAGINDEKDGLFGTLMPED
jgi:uncharacterized protein (TIGR03118 family)